MVVKPSPSPHQFTVRVSPELADSFESLIAIYQDVAPPGIKVGRSDVLRASFERGVASLTAELVRKGAKGSPRRRRS